MYEALNMAQVWGAPLLVVVEHNRIAQSTPTTGADGGLDRGPLRRASGWRTTGSSRSTSTWCARSCPAWLEMVRRDKRPAVFEVSVHRAGPHSKGDDTRTAGRTGRGRRRGLVRALPA